MTTADANTPTCPLRCDHRHDIEIGVWFDYFVQNREMEAAQCIILAHHPVVSHRSMTRPPPKLKAIKVVDTSYDSAITTVLQQSWDDFLVQCLDFKKNRE